jgi:hypothetical protein
VNWLHGRVLLILDAGTIHQESEWQDKMRLTTKVVEEPDKEGQDDAENEAGDYGEVKGSVLTAMDDVARETAQAEREFTAKVEKRAKNGQDAAEDQETAADVAKRIHKTIIEEPPACW